MTDDEALALKPGDRVVTRVGTWVGPVVVVRARDGRNDSYRPGVWVTVRRAGLNFVGQRKPAFRRRPDKIHAAPPGLDPLAANVYADWLEENGEPRAAVKLRSAFPLDKGAAS